MTAAIKLTPILVGLGLLLINLFAEAVDPPSALSSDNQSLNTQTFIPFVGQSVNFQKSLAGLVYKNDQGLWVIDPAGHPKFLLDQPEGRLSPDGQQVVYWLVEGEEANDILLADLSTGERKNLTRSAGRIDRFPEWWPARPGQIVFGSQESETYPGGPSRGNLSTMLSDGSGFAEIDDEGGFWALSPGGTSIAYGGLDNLGNIYRWKDGIEELAPADYGVSVVKLFQPSWSPDEKRLAWSAATDLDGTLGLAVFDLEAKTGQVRHAYSPTAGPVELHYLSWSPDGAWLAFVAWSEAGGQAEPGELDPQLWAIDPGSDQEVEIGQGFHPVWNRGGSLLAFTRGKPGSGRGVWVAPSGEWTPIQVLPPGNEAVDWIEFIN